MSTEPELLVPHAVNYHIPAAVRGQNPKREKGEVGKDSEVFIAEAQSVLVNVSTAQKLCGFITAIISSTVGSVEDLNSFPTCDFGVFHHL